MSNIAPNAELTRRARESLAGNWGLAISTLLIYAFIMLCINLIPVVGWFIALFIGGPFALGYVYFNLALTRQDSPKVEMIFSGFKFLDSSIIANILIAIFTFLWLLCLIVPGLIAMYAYSMTFYILADNPNMAANDAITASKTMMKGHKFRLLCLNFRFFGWILLSILTFGIGFIWTWPYLVASYAHFYQDLKMHTGDQDGAIDYMPANHIA